MGDESGVVQLFRSSSGFGGSGVGFRDHWDFGLGACLVFRRFKLEGYSVNGQGSKDGAVLGVPMLRIIICQFRLETLP